MNSAKPMNHSSRIKFSRLFNFVVSVVVFVFDVLRDLLLKISVGKSPGTCVVLYYHSIPTEQRALFASQLDSINRMGKVVDVTQEIMIEPGVRHIGITFDDAFENFVSEALPELQKRRVPATLFVITGALGKSFGPSNAPERVMTVSQLRGLPPDLISIGSHTVTHPYLPELDDLAARRELTESKSELELILGRETSAFSFPFGGFTDHLVELANEAGYRSIFTTLPRFAFSNGSPASTIGRVRVDATDWPLESRLKFAGAYRWLPLAMYLKGRFKKLWKSRVKNSDTARVRSQIQIDQPSQ